MKKKNFDLKSLKVPEKSLLKLLKDLARISSTSDDIRGLKKMADKLESVFKPLSDTFERIKLPSSREILLFHKRSSAKKRFLLGGHMDTVLPAKPLVEKDGKLIGSGVADMKGGLAVIFGALSLYEKESPSAGWTLIINADEEIGSLESRSYFERMQGQVEAAFLTEPAFYDGALVSSRPSSFVGELHAYGEKAHAGRIKTYKSATAALVEILAWLDHTYHLKDDIMVNIGTLMGGVASNVVADKADALINIRSVSQEKMDALLGQLLHQCREVGKRRDITFEWKEKSYRPAKPFSKTTQMLADTYSQISESLGHPITWRPSGGVTDGNFLEHHGIPTLDTLGVIGGELHSEDEWMQLSSLSLKVKALLGILLNFS